MSAWPSEYGIERDDNVADAITQQRFGCYEDAYDVLERYYADVCCSDERVFYRILRVAQHPLRGD